MAKNCSVNVVAESITNIHRHEKMQILKHVNQGIMSLSLINMKHNFIIERNIY